MYGHQNTAIVVTPTKRHSAVEYIRTKSKVAGDCEQRSPMTEVPNHYKQYESTEDQSLTGKQFKLSYLLVII